jgi:parallel beta-helix repeat protein
MMQSQISGELLIGIPKVEYPGPSGRLVPGTPHDPITIDGDANFSDTALLEGWPGDGSPENPFIISGLDIRSEANFLPCIDISNTRVSFTISHCNLIDSHGGNGEENWRAAGICLYNVTNGLLVNNICSNNKRGINLVESDSNIVVNNNCSRSLEWGIFLHRSDHNTVVNNTCNGNGDEIEGEFIQGGYGIFLGDSNSNIVENNTCNNNGCGIRLEGSDSNTVADNTCNTNEYGISLFNSDSITMANNTCSNNDRGITLYLSESNTVANNMCNSNDKGIELEHSEFNTVSDNTCNNNRIGIYLYYSDFNTVANNTCLGNIEHDIFDESGTEVSTEESEREELAHREYVAKQFVWLLAGCGMILVTSVIALAQFRRMEIH